MYGEYFRRVLSSVDVMSLPLIALAIFIFAFGAIMFRALRKPASYYDSTAALPLLSDAEFPSEKGTSAAKEASQAQQGESR